VVDHADGSAQLAREVLAAQRAYMGMDINQPLTLTVEQTAKLLGIGRSTAYELVHTGDIPSLRLGRRIVVPIALLRPLLGICADRSLGRPAGSHEGQNMHTEMTQAELPLGLSL
jgi:excisionase family DNA binding protein